MADRGGSAFAAGMLTGTVVGAALAVLVAPREASSSVRDGAINDGKAAAEQRRADLSKAE